MKLYWCPKTRSIRILWLLEETGLSYERLQIDIHNPKHKNDPDLRHISPINKMPAFEDGPVRLWDSGAITTYVADQYPEAGLAIEIGEPERGAYLQWILFTNSVIEPAMGEKFGKLPSNPSQYGWGGWDQMLTAFRSGVEKGPWVLGDRFTAADVLLGMSAHYLRQFGALTDDPILFSYADRCAARPAFQRMLALEAAAGN